MQTLYHETLSHAVSNVSHQLPVDYQEIKDSFEVGLQLSETSGSTVPPPMRTDRIWFTYHSLGFYLQDN